MDILKLLLSALQLVVEGVEPFLPPCLGFILLDQEGRILMSTKASRRFCQILEQGECSPEQDLAMISLPRIIQSSVQYFMNNMGQLGIQIFRVDVTSQAEDRIQMEIILINWNPAEKSFFLWVNLINVAEWNEQLARGDAYQYHLTKAETDIWKLRRQGLSYSQIAQKMYISVHTVKKHITSVNSKMRDCH